MGELVSVTVTVTPVTGTAIPTGTITFTDTAGGSATVPLNSAGKIVVSTSKTPAGTYSVYAAYNGAADFTKSTSATETETITAARSN